MTIQAIRFAVRTSIKSVLTPTTSAIPLCRSLENGAIPAAAHGQTRLLRSVIGGSNDSVGVRSRSGEEEELRGLSAEEISRIGERTQQMWKEHIALNTSFPEASLPPRGSEASVDPETVRRKRLVYRSKQRGWLEVDLLLGTWAEKNVPTLTLEEMNNYEVILNLETIDIFNFITGNAEPPSFVDTSMMKRLQEYAMSNPLGQSPESYAMEKRRSNLT